MTTTTINRTATKNGATVLPMRKRADANAATVQSAMGKMYPGLSVGPAKKPATKTPQVAALPGMTPLGIPAAAVQITGRVLDDLSVPAFLDRANPANEAKATTAREKRAEELRRKAADAATAAAATAAAKPAKSDAPKADAPKGKPGKPVAKGKAVKAATVAKVAGAKGKGTADAPASSILRTTGLGPLKAKKGETVRADGLPVNGIDDYLIDAVLAKGGALHSVMSKHLDWKGCGRRLARAAAVAKVKLTAVYEGDDIRITGAR